MPDLAQDVESVVGLLAQSGDGTTVTDSPFRQALQQAGELSKRILAGETTGDRILDFVIVHHRLPNEEIVAVYRGLEDRLRQHVGELVLMVTKEESPGIRRTFFRVPDDDEYVIDERINLAVIKGGDLVTDFEAQKCGINVGGVMVTLRPHCEEAPMQMWNGGYLDPQHWDFGCLNKSLECKNPSNRGRREAPLMLEVVIGDAEVVEWFGKGTLSYQMTFRKAARLLGRLVPETSEVAAELERRRKAVIGKLLEFVLQRHQLRSTGDLYTKGGYSLGQVEEQIKRILVIAIELDMADRQLLSVRGLCQEYNIPVQ